MILSELKAIMPLANLQRAKAALEPLNRAMAEFGIDTPQRQAAFLAQIGHESGSLRYVEELASGHAYDNRVDLGNTDEYARKLADEQGTTVGCFYKGRGYIQLTGYYNYAACGDALGLDLVHKPELLCIPENAARSAGWFWKRNGLNVYADVKDFDGVSDKVNRGHKTAKEGDSLGYADRLAFYRRACTILGA